MNIVHIDLPKSDLMVEAAPLPNHICLFPCPETEQGEEG